MFHTVHSASTPIPIITSENPSPEEIFCQTSLNLTVAEALNQWRCEPEMVIRRAIQMTRRPREIVLEAVRAVFPFQGVCPKPSTAFYALLASNMHLQQLFDPKNQMNISRFTESQVVFRNLAILLQDFILLYPEGNEDQWVSFLEEKQVYAQLELNADFKEQFYQILKTLYQEIQYPIQPVEEVFSLCFLHRIYMLRNAVIGIQDPQKMIDQIVRVTKKQMGHDQLEQLKTTLPKHGEAFIKESIRLHFHHLQKPSPETFEEFVKSLNVVCNSCVPFLRRATLSLLSEEIDYQVDDSTMLMTCHQGGDNDRAPIACTLLQAFLNYCGYQAEIYTRKDINPKLSVSFAHAILLATDPITHKQVLIDPTFKQFLFGFIPMKSLLEDFLDVRVIAAESCDQEIESLLEYRRLALRSAAQSGKLFRISEEEFIHHFRTIWGIEGYCRVTRNLNIEAIFADNPLDSPGCQSVRTLLQTIGLRQTLMRPTFDQKAVTILREAPNLSVAELMEKLTTLPDHQMKLFVGELGLDDRPIRNGLLSVKTAGYLMALRQQVNPANESETTTIYGCAGADLSLLLALNTAHLYMVERTPVDFKKMQAALENGIIHGFNALSKKYLELKSQHGAGFAGHPSPQVDYQDVMQNIEWKIVTELLAMGIDLSKVNIQEAPDFHGVTLSFTWNYLGKREQMYHATWVSTHLEEPESYPVGFRGLLNAKNIDFYYQKAANHVPQYYDQFLPVIADAMKLNGYFLTSDYDMLGGKHPPDSLLVREDTRFQFIEETPLIRAYRKLFGGTLALGWRYGFFDNMEERLIPPQEEYLTFVDVRKKLKNE